MGSLSQGALPRPPCLGLATQQARTTRCVVQSVPEAKAIAGKPGHMASLAAMSSVTLRTSMPSLLEQRSSVISTSSGGEGDYAPAASGQASGERGEGNERKLATMRNVAGQEGRIIEEVLHALHRAHTVSADRLTDMQELRRKLDEVRRLFRAPRPSVLGLAFA